MGLHVIKKGLDLPISGAPEQVVHAAASVRRVAVLGEDYVGMKPAFAVQPGDTVARGQLLFEDRKTPGVRFTSPAAGKVAAIHRGDRRAFLSVVIELNDNELRGTLKDSDFMPFASFNPKDPALYSAAEIKALLIESGLWTALRTRPFSKTPSPDGAPHAIFVTATDSNPLAPSMDVVGVGHDADINAGLRALSQLTRGRVYFCKGAGSPLRPSQQLGIAVEEFSGPHPAGLVGTHIHLLDPVNSKKSVWHIGLQDLIAVGSLLRTGKLHVDRIVSLAGPGVLNPRLLRTRLGASIDELVAGELADGEMRIISGSILSGRASQGEVLGYVGRFHQQVSVIREGREREFLGWLAPGTDKFSVTRVFLGHLIPDKKFAFTTSTNGSRRAMVPIGTYEKVMPLDILPTFLLRSLIVGDIERAEQLGCLELDEEDLGLCTFVCPGKYDYAPILRRNLDIIEKEG